MKRSAENWLAEIKLERQARRIARNVVTTSSPRATVLTAKFVSPKIPG